MQHPAPHGTAVAAPEGTWPLPARKEATRPSQGERGLPRARVLCVPREGAVRAARSCLACSQARAACPAIVGSLPREPALLAARVGAACRAQALPRSSVGCVPWWRAPAALPRSSVGSLPRECQVHAARALVSFPASVRCGHARLGYIPRTSSRCLPREWVKHALLGNGQPRAQELASLPRERAQPRARAWACLSRERW